MSREVRHIVLSSPVHLFSFGFGAGFSPIAPGTAGTLLGVVVYLALASFDPVIYLIAVLGLFLAGCWACGQTASVLGVPDHPGIVIDEIVGYLVTMLLVPLTWYWVLAGFFLFRVFDIWKPWPVSLADRKVPGGFGIMVDDVLAALYALLCLHVLVWTVQQV